MVNLYGEKRKINAISVVKSAIETVDLVMKRIAGSYVYWYNWKYYRKGHLFQDRFKSEPVENDAYF